MKKSICTLTLAVFTFMACSPDTEYDSYPQWDKAAVLPKHNISHPKMSLEADSIIEDEDWELSIPNAFANPQSVSGHIENPDFDSIPPIPETEPFILED